MMSLSWVPPDFWTERGHTGMRGVGSRQWGRGAGRGAGREVVPELTILCVARSRRRVGIRGSRRGYSS